MPPMDFNTIRRIAEQDLSAIAELETVSELSVGKFLKQDLLRFLII
jgi:hypothetical protein